MEREIKKILYKVLPFVLCVCIVSGAAAPAYASPTTIDQWAQYDGSGWSYNSSAGTFSWNTNMANSSEFVILSYLRDLYSSVKIYNDNLKSGWLFSSSGYSYPNGWSGSFYKVALDMINNVNTSVNNNFHSNLQSYSSYPLYSYKSFIDSGLNNSQSFSSNNFIINFLSGISALNTNISYIANQFYADNTSGSYNARSLLNQALHKYVDSSTLDYTTVLNNIKSNTDYLSSINTYTANLSGIKTDTANLSGIKTDTANLSGIKSDTSNLSAILTGVTDFKTANHSDITSFNDDYNNINWVNGGTYLGAKSDLNDDYILVQTNETDAYFLFQLEPGFYIYDLKFPVRSSSAGNMASNYSLNAYLIRNTSPLKIENFDYDINVAGNGTHVYVYLTVDNGNSRIIAFQLNSNNNTEYSINPSITPYAMGVTNDTKDFYDVGSWLDDRNILKLFKQAKEVFFDDKTIAAKKANQDQEDTVLTNFTGSGAASASVSDFGAVKDSMVDLKAGFSGGASSSDTFSFLSGDSNAWDWFTQDTANDLDRTQGSNTSLLRSSSSVASDTPLLDSYYTSILSILGGE